PRRRAGDHRTLAGGRARAHRVRRALTSRHGIHRPPLVLVRPEDSVHDRSRSVPATRGVLIVNALPPEEAASPLGGGLATAALRGVGWRFASELGGKGMVLVSTIVLA